MKEFILLVACMLCIGSCTTEENQENNLHSKPAPITGTWKLISGTTIKDKDTTTTDYTQGQEMIKIINETHFSFLRHDLQKGKDSSAVFAAGGGTYTLKGDQYIEHLDYFSSREWEGNSFEFTYKIDGDTLTTTGVEEVKELNINHLNIEKYHRVK